MRKNVCGLIYAGEENLNLRELVNKRSVGALPVGGRYRAIDFILSNMVNSGIRNIGVIPRRNYHSMMDHLGSGKEWDLNRKEDGLIIIPPYDIMDRLTPCRAPRRFCAARRRNTACLQAQAQSIRIHTTRCSTFM